MNSIRLVFSHTFLVIFLSGILLSTKATADAHHYGLAAFHAPIVFQETGHDPKADAITKFDFDGDFTGNNNWENLRSSSTPAFVYYDVRESKSHYFIMYSFFHPRDYSYVCIPWICHENDLEGAMLTIEKSESNPMGRLIAIQTLAHDRIYTHETDEEISNFRGPAEASAEKVALFIEWGGHGVYAWNPIEESKLKEDKPTLLYDYEQIMATVPETYSKDWLVYQYGGSSDDPQGVAEGRFRYELLPIDEELWNRRDKIGHEHTFAKLYDFVGERFQLPELPAAFSGQKWGTGRARPPWAWTDIFTTGEKRGEWFLDPAFYLTKKVKKYKKTISLDYIHNPYVN